MKMEATVEELRALLLIAELDAQAQGLPDETHEKRADAGRKRVNRALLERYQALLDAGRFPVFVAIERGCCSGCHLRLPTMVESRARHSPAVHTCPHCRRMLYAPELLTAEDSRAEGSRKKRPSQRVAQASAGERS